MFLSNLFPSFSTNISGGRSLWALNSSFKKLSDQSWSDVQVGRSSYIAIKNDGTLWAWGSNIYGQLGLGTNYSDFGYVKLPTKANGLWDKASINLYNFLSIKSDGTLWSCGRDNYGQLGQNTGGYKAGVFDNQYVITPQQIGSDYWIDMKAGSSNNSIAIKNDGTLWTWGANYYGELGNGKVTHLYDYPTDAFITYPNKIKTNNQWVTVKVSSSSGAAIDSNGSLWTWGYNVYGELGHGKNGNQVYSPTQVGTSSWTSVSIGAWRGYRIFMSAIRSDGTLWAWGDNTNGQLGQGDNNDSYSPVQIGTDSDWKIISSGYAQSAAIKSDGTLWVWGANGYGELGQGDYNDRSLPVQIGTSSWSFVSAGYGRTHAIDINGNLFGSGKNTGGQLGVSSVIIGNGSSSFVLIPSSQSWTFVDNSATDYNYGIKKDKTLWTWGSYYGSDGATSASIGYYNASTGGGILEYWQPVKVTNDTWEKVYCGYHYVHGIKTDGSLWAWGVNYNGQFGLGDKYDKVYSINYDPVLYYSPVLVSSDKWKDISTTRLTYQFAYHHTIGIKSDGTVWGWGANYYAVVNPVTRDSITRSPIQVGTSSWSSVYSGLGSNYAIGPDGSLWAWGNNFYGKLGLGDGKYRYTPTKVNNFSWSFISAAEGRGNIVFGIKSDRTLWTWGDTYAFPWVDDTRDKLGYLTTSPINRHSGNNWNNLSGNGYMSMFGIKTDGTLWGWGRNSFGELGQSDTIHRSSPVQVGGSWSSITSGGSLSLGIKSNGTLWAWGNNNYGQLGQNDFIYRSSPVQIGTSSWTSVSAGYYHTLAIRSDGSLWSWGNNRGGCLGLGDYNDRSSPVQVGTSSWSSVSSGSLQSLGIKKDGTLWAWGYNFSGSLGLGDTISRSSPVQVGTSSWSSVSYGLNFSLSIRSDGTLWAWGNNSDGQLGLGDRNSRSSPVQVGTSSWSSVFSGTSYVIALKADKSLWVWGNNSRGYLGQGDTLSRSSPVQIGTSSWTFVSATQFGAASIDLSGRLWEWGILPPFLWNGTSLPVQVGNFSWNLVSCSTDYNQFHYGAIRSDGTLWTWGYNAAGQLGQGDTIIRSSPVQVGTSSWSSVSCGSSYTLAIRSDGTLWSWGKNYNLGQNDLVDRSSPVQIGSNTNWVSVYANTSISSAINSDSNLFLWGFVRFGGLPNQPIGSYINSSQYSPVLVSSLKNWSKVSIYDESVLAIKTDGSLWAWGSNTWGPLGQGDTIHRSSPVQVGTSSWTSIASGAGFSLAIKSDNTLWAWGYNLSGQLGQGDTNPRSSPVQIGTSSWTFVSAGTGASYAIRSDSSLWAWGFNVFGQLGLGDTISKSSPVQVGTSSWSSVSAGRSHTLAIRSDGSLWSFGRNNSGQLGTGDTFHRSSPVQVGTSSWSFVSAGFDSSYGLKPDGTLWIWGITSKTSGLPGICSSPVQISTSSTYLSSFYRFSVTRSVDSTTNVYNNYPFIALIGS